MYQEGKIRTVRVSVQQRQHLEKMQQHPGSFKRVTTSVAPAESPQALLPYGRFKNGCSGAAC